MNITQKFLAVSCAFLLVGGPSYGAEPQKESAGEYFDDSMTTTRVKAAMFSEPSLKMLDIKVETYKGEVQLSGFVGSEDEMKKAVEVARTVKGVKDVKNDMRLKAAK